MKKKKNMMKRWLLMSVLLLSAVSMKAQKIPQVIFCGNINTLYFINSEEYNVGDTYNGETITNKWKGDQVINLEEGTAPLWASNSTVRDYVYKVVFDSSFAEVLPTSGFRWFDQCVWLAEIVGLQYLNTSEMKSMKLMFHNCGCLTSLDLSTFDTQNVTDMASMFEKCSQLKTLTLDKSKFNTANVTDMAGMFCDCSALESLDVSGFETGNVTSMQLMFRGCSKLPTLAVSNWDTKNVTTMYFMFGYCEKLTELDVSNWNTGNVTTMEGVFFGCEMLPTIDVSKWNTANVENMHQMFQDCKALKSLTLSSFETKKVTNMKNMFNTCKQLTELDLSTFNTPELMVMDNMFAHCEQLKSITFSPNFNTSKVTNMTAVFMNCSSLESLDLSMFDTQNVTDMQVMFHNCTKLKYLDLTKFNTAKAQQMANIFTYESTAPTQNRIIYIGSGWSTENVASTNYGYPVTLFMGNNNDVMGGNGTTIDENTAKEYAKADKPGDPGLLTDRIYLLNKNDDGRTEKVLDVFISRGMSSDGKPEPVPVCLYDRTLFQDNDWNTICLPFALTKDQIAENLPGAIIRELTSSEIRGGQLRLNFTPVDAIEAGKPYIVKWTSGSNLPNHDFNGVTITTKTPQTITTGEGKLKINFIGTFKPTTLKNDKTEFYLYTGTELKYPANANHPINAFRGYFQISKEVFEAASKIVMNFDDDTTAIETVLTEPTKTTSDAIYDLQGRRVANPGKGVYIVNGKKVIK